MICSFKWIVALLLLSVIIGCTYSGSYSDGALGSNEKSQTFLNIVKQNLPSNNDSLNHVLYIGQSQCATCYNFVLTQKNRQIGNRIWVVLYTDTSRVRGFKNYYLDKDLKFKNVSGIHSKSYLFSYFRDSVVNFTPIASLDDIKQVDDYFYRR
jgi:hypothetical protein